ncbi:putative immunoglobulin domain superfamily (Sensory guidance protein) [Fasciola hepatica]|uniref:Immunoglobulin domain superfamily (Sensory guidance protein) n=1 Tax=Fasciola hepatica TaxID=6192 RepID=A0A4E0RD21_FASHE|nr:putative immunoglobulin domain superfamily (Sensory guidance protein) [Fasciola hepatica]
MEGKTAEFECEIDVFQSRYLEINGVQFFPASSKNRAALIEQFPYLKDVQIAPLDVQGSRLKYRASNLLFTPGSAFGSSHTVTIIGANLYGFARVSTFVNVLPRPKVLDSPTRYHCVKPCLSSVEHVYDCQFDLTRYQMAHVEQTWDLNGLDVSKLLEDKDDRAEYLVTEGTKLIVDGICPQKYVLQAQDSSGECLTTSFVIISYVYSAFYSVYFLLLLESDSVPLCICTSVLAATASISWIAAVIIAIVVIIAIGALTACIVMHARGETYLLDREERALGNDPEKELREKESFRTYERAEEPPLRGSRCSLNDDSAEIGSDADGELDDYNLDPGKFNEEGSFIDQYATETHYKGASRLPTLPRA